LEQQNLVLLAPSPARGWAGKIIQMHPAPDNGPCQDMLSTLKEPKSIIHSLTKYGDMISLVGRSKVWILQMA
jgi:hypothetical protein